MKKFALIFLFLMTTIRAHSASVPDDRVVLYDMKEDPSIAAFINVKEIPGFFVMEIDEFQGRAAIVYREGEDVFRSPADLKIKGNEITLKNKKNRRKWRMEERPLPSGRTETVIYSSDCPPEKSGWRYGGSFGRHLVRRNDDIGRKLVAVQADLEFQTRMERCTGPESECGPPGCADSLGGAVASTGTSNRTNSTPLSVTPSVKLSTAMIEATLPAEEILTTYKRDINNVLPATLPGLSVETTGYITRNIPYPFMANPTFEQQRKPVGVLYKTYYSTRTAGSVRIEVAPLAAEFHSASPTKCGAWEINPMRTPFMVRGHTALYIETPATGLAPAQTAIAVCGQTVSVMLETQSAQTKEFMTALFDTFPMGQMETIIGGGR